MNRVVLAFVAIILTTTVFAGCLGGDDIDASIPTIHVVVQQVEGEEDTFLFDGSGSTGTGLDFNWSFGDGSLSDEAKATHTYVHGSGTYTAALVITDANGITDEWSGEVVVGTGQNNVPTARFTPEVRYLAVGEPLTVDASATTDPEEDPIRYEWDFNFLMKTDEYDAFRAAKSGDGEDEETYEAKSAASPLDLVKRALERLRGPFYKTPGHPSGGTEPPVSMFEGRRTAEDPVYTLQEGFPEATRFYVKLTAVDVKGASEAVVSEEIWPVVVVDERESDIQEDTRTGTFEFGAVPSVTEAVDDEGMPFTHTFTWSFEIPRDIELMYFNVSWSQNDVHGATGEFGNNIHLELIPPRGEEYMRKDFKQVADRESESISLEMNRAQGLGSGKWTAHLYARQGIDIDYTTGYWAQMDMLEPVLREIENEYD